MKKHPEIFFEHMLLAIEKIGKYISKCNYKDFVVDEKTQDAVIRQLEIIGKAAGKIPISLIKDSPVPWEAITGMRHRLIHDYMGVDLDIVWYTAFKGLLPLKKYLKQKL